MQIVHPNHHGLLCIARHQRIYIEAQAVCVKVLDGRMRRMGELNKHDIVVELGLHLLTVVGPY